jgi:hypothetical protein
MNKMDSDRRGAFVSTEKVSFSGRRSRVARLSVAILSSLFATVSCVQHLNRVPRGALEQLAGNGAHFVLVFGSLSTPGGKLDRPAIRFLHPDASGTPDALLWSTTISTGQRFYAVLPAPHTANYLDAFYVEVGSETAGFDRIIYAHMREGQEPLAMYVGEIEVRPAPDRSAQGQKVVVEARDDFRNAERELRRLYPRFGGAIVKMAPVRSAVQNGAGQSAGRSAGPTAAAAAR